MWLSVGFPTCPSCENNNNRCYHKDCPKGAKEPMQINPDTSVVQCPSCSYEWHIKDSRYYCSCGHVFSADDVIEEVDAIIINAKLIAKELRRAASTRERISSMTTRDIEIKAESTIKKSFGETLWNLIKKSIPSIVVAIKEWFNIK